jgi:hypothetical protein
MRNHDAPLLLGPWSQLVVTSVEEKEGASVAKLHLGVSRVGKIEVTRS